MLERLPQAALAAIFLVVQGAAVLLAPVFLPEQAAFPDPDNVVNPLIYVAMVIVMTAFILLLIKYGGERIVQIIFFTAVFITMMYVVAPVLSLVIDDWSIIIPMAAIVSILALVALLKSGEWYIIDSIGLILAIGVTALLGMSLSILPILVLLIVMAVYDAISVYKTKHMVALAEGVIPLRLPVLFVVPKERGFSMRQVEETGLVKEEGEERDAYFMGLGDTVIPGLLVVSASLYLPETGSFLLTANLWAAIGAMLGGLAGYACLMRLVASGKPQAGLPLLNSGAILGYIAAYVIVYGTVSLEMIGL